MTVARLLPSNAAPFELALADAMSDVLPVPIREVMDAEETPEEFLPYLAASEGVTLWYDDWPVERKRRVAKRWLADYASIIGTRAAPAPFLALVDADLIDRVTYPRRFVLGHSFIRAGVTVNIQHHTARYLVKASPRTIPGALVLGRSRLTDGHCLHRADNTDINRAKEALVASKSPDTAYSATFAHKRHHTFGDGVAFADAPRFGAFIDRTHL